MASATAASRAESGIADPVKAVSVVSTGTVEIHPEHAFGSRKPLYWWLLNIALSVRVMLDGLDERDLRGGLLKEDDG
jgi:hypothetical protein